MQRGDKVKIKRGPLRGMTATLRRYDSANRAWHAEVNGDAVLVYNYEMVDVVERKKRESKRG